MSEDKTNYDLTKRWHAYFEAKKELEIVYLELLSESLKAKAKGEEIMGITIKKPGTRVDNKAALEYAQAQGWEIPYYQPEPTVDHDKLKEIFKEHNVKVPVMEIKGSASLKE